MLARFNRSIARVASVPGLADEQAVGGPCSVPADTRLLVRMQEATSCDGSS